MLENLHRTKEIGLESRGLLEAGDLVGYGELMHEHWENKRAPLAGDDHRAHRHALHAARRAGAVGGKLVGAGGGGFLLVYARQPDDARQAMAAAGAPEVRFDFDFQGCVGQEYAMSAPCAWRSSAAA